MRRVGLLARRAAELPRFRVRAQLRHTAGYGAELELEPLAWQTTRAGDLPYDLIPEDVPLEERAPMAGQVIAQADERAWSGAQVILDRIAASGVMLAESEERAIAEIADAIEDPTDLSVDAAVGATLDVVRELSRYEDPAARALGHAIAGDLGHLNALGFQIISLPR